MRECDSGRKRRQRPAEQVYLNGWKWGVGATYLQREKISCTVAYRRAHMGKHVVTLVQHLWLYRLILSKSLTISHIWKLRVTLTRFFGHSERMRATLILFIFLLFEAVDADYLTQFQEFYNSTGGKSCPSSLIKLLRSRMVAKWRVERHQPLWLFWCWVCAIHRTQLLQDQSLWQQSQRGSFAFLLWHTFWIFRSVLQQIDWKSRSFRNRMHLA